MINGLSRWNALGILTNGIAGVHVAVGRREVTAGHVNPNNGGSLYKGGELLVAINTVYHDAEHPSAVVFMPTTFTE